MNKQTIYEAPQAELIVVRFEGNFCATGDPTPGTAGETNTINEYGEDF